MVQCGNWAFHRLVVVYKKITNSNYWQKRYMVKYKLVKEENNEIE